MIPVCCWGRQKEILKNNWYCSGWVFFKRHDKKVQESTCHGINGENNWCCISHLVIKVHLPQNQGPVSIYRPSFPGMGIPMLKIRRSRDRLIFNMGIPILRRPPVLFNSMRLSDTYVSVIESSLVQIMACRLVGAKPLSKLILEYCWLHTWEQTSVKF